MGANMARRLVRGGHAITVFDLDANRVREVAADGAHGAASRVRRVLGILETVVGYDRLHVGGGNARRIAFPLGRRVRTVDNTAGLQGGIALWR